jgi:predicted alpha/beta hydrolase family esterase
VSQGGVLDLATGAGGRVGRGAIVDLLGGQPDAVRQRYALADPMQRLPLDVPVVCVHSQQDAQVPFAQSVAYVSAATAAGSAARLVETQGDHFTLIEVDHPDWATAVEAITSLL